MLKKIKSENGSALAVVMIVCAAVTVLVAALLPLVSYLSQRTAVQVTNNRAAVICQSALEYAKQELYNDAASDDFDLSDYTLYVKYDNNGYSRSDESNYIVKTQVSEKNTGAYDENGKVYTVIFTAAYEGYQKEFAVDCAVAPNNAGLSIKAQFAENTEKNNNEEVTFGNNKIDREGTEDAS